MGKPASALGPLGVVTLALLVERPMHPYEMYQLLIARGEQRIVKVRPGSLYHTIDRLVDSGLAESVGTERAGNRPERTVYAITDLGREKLDTRVAELLRAPVNEYALFPVAIGEAHNLSGGTFRGLLAQRLERLEAERSDVASEVAAARSRGVPRRWKLDSEFLVAQLDAEITWVESVIGELDAGTLDWEEPRPDSLRGTPTSGDPLND
ncbi:PadR family transcriptional regulator [Demequina aurantiaca]|uniref:PadR family transcriptional regulator n=1 Tax=Demequina aurantiaca TaxID=676200 RepID=UPI000A5100E1|nr:PadR family transcriptional regulator [Demequina aurantiaca]